MIVDAITDLVERRRRNDRQIVLGIRRVGVLPFAPLSQRLVVPSIAHDGPPAGFT